MALNRDWTTGYFVCYSIDIFTQVTPMGVEILSDRNLLEVTIYGQFKFIQSYWSYFWRDDNINRAAIFTGQINTLGVVHYTSHPV